MKNIISFLSILIGGLLQATLLEGVKVFNLKPDLILINVVVISLSLDPKVSFILSIFAGMLKDIFSANSFGVNTLLMPIWSFAVSRLARGISLDTDFRRIVLIFVISALHNIFTAAILSYLGNPVSLGFFLRAVFAGSIYTGFAAFLGLRIIKNFSPGFFER